MRHTKRIKAVLIAAALLFAAANADARQITLTWDANQEPSVVGYLVYYGTQPREITEYDGIINVGNLLSVQLDLPGDQYFFAIRAYDADGNLSPLSLEVGETPNVALTNPGNQIGNAGDVVSLQLFATGDAMSYGAIGLPAGLVIDPLIGQITGTLGASTETATVYTVTVAVTDRNGKVSSVQFRWLLKTNHPPTVTEPRTQSTVIGAPVELFVPAWDDDGDSVTFSAVGLPPGLTLDPWSGEISGTIAANAPTIYNVVVNVSDGFLVTPVQFAWVLSAPGAFGVDQVVFADSMTSTVTTEPFTTSAPGETLIAFVSSDQWPIDQQGQTATVTGGGLEWTLVTRANGVYGSAEIWKATTASIVPDLAVTATMSIGEAPMSMTVMSFVGSAGVGAFAAASGESGPPTVSLTTMAANSLVFAAGNDWDGGVERTPADHQSIIHQVALPDPGYTLWLQNYLLPIGAPGTVVQISDVAPSDHRWNVAAVEIVPLAAPVERVFTIDDVSVAEGNYGTTSATFTVTLQPPSSEEATVYFATADGTARAFRDYFPAWGRLKFPAGTTTQTITVKVLGDSYIEPDETFVVNLYGATNAKIKNDQGVGTIVNDDVAPSEGRMFGIGRIDEGRTHHHFVFRVSQRNSREYASLEYWSIDSRNCDDDNDRDGDGDGDRDRDYGRDHRNPIRRFESTSVTSVTFTDDPAFKPGSGRREPTIDSVVFTGVGKWNGKSGYTFEARATDQGEPGRQRDTFSLVVKDSRGAVVASLSDRLAAGNVQSTRLRKHW